MEILTRPVKACSKSISLKHSDLHMLEYLVYTNPKTKILIRKVELQMNRHYSLIRTPRISRTALLCPTGSFKSSECSIPSKY
jgi:hypothetical protein